MVEISKFYTFKKYILMLTSFRSWVSQLTQSRPGHDLTWVFQYWLSVTSLLRSWRESVLRLWMMILTRIQTITKHICLSRGETLTAQWWRMDWSKLSIVESNKIMRKISCSGALFKMNWYHLLHRWEKYSAASSALVRTKQGRIIRLSDD